MNRHLCFNLPLRAKRSFYVTLRSLALRPFSVLRFLRNIIPYRVPYVVLPLREFGVRCVVGCLSLISLLPTGADKFEGFRRRRF